MKKVIAILALFSTLISNAYAEYDWTEVYIEAVPGYYAETDNLYGINYAPERLIWGSVTENFVAKDKKTILTFDTSIIPANATVTHVFIIAGDEIITGTDGWTPEQRMEYIHENLVAEFAPLGGFGGSYFPTIYDYYSYAIDSSPVESYGFMLTDTSSLSNINKYGYTQLKVGFKTNPEKISISARYIWSHHGNQHPQIKVRYTLP